MAFEMLQISENSKIFSPRAADRLVVKGQYKILKNKIQIA
jgi:hypothetical protein